MCICMILLMRMAGGHRFCGEGQLRSFAYEPSYFGIEALFLLPLLWYRALELKEKHVGLVLILFTYMVFLTHARTAQVIYLGELLLLIFLSLLGRYPAWGKRLVQVFIVTGLAFSIYLVLPMALSAIREKEAQVLCSQWRLSKNMSAKMLLQLGKSRSGLIWHGGGIR